MQNHQIYCSDCSLGMIKYNENIVNCYLLAASDADADEWAVRALRLAITAGVP